MSHEQKNDLQFSALDFLNVVGDALIKYGVKEQTPPYSYVVKFEFPDGTYKKFMSDLKAISEAIGNQEGESEICYAGFKFFVKKTAK